MQLGSFPTPVEHLPELGLWVKRDDLTNPRYGGNKVRKLERVLETLKQKGVKRLVTVGAAGSHHVLATSIFAPEHGIEVEAVLVPQIRTPHVEEDLRAIAARARIFPASSYPHAGTIVLDRMACGSAYVPPGGSNHDGALAYADAARELLAQVDQGLLPMPDSVVVTLGSGGTAGGLAAGFAEVPRVRVLGVLVSEPKALVALHARRLAAACSIEPARLEVTDAYLGAGYGAPTRAGDEAIRVAEAQGLSLDSTYTAKTFAAALDDVQRAPNETVLYWHTLSSAPLAPLLEGAPALDELPEELRALLVSHIG